MKQIWIEDDIHKNLIKESARRTLASGKRMTLGQVANDLIMEAINNSKPIELGDSLHMNLDAKPDDEQIDIPAKPEPPSDRSLKEGEQPSKQSKSSFDFGALDI